MNPHFLSDRNTEMKFTKIYRNELLSEGQAASLTMWLSPKDEY